MCVCICIYIPKTVEKRKKSTSTLVKPLASINIITKSHIFCMLIRRSQKQ